MQSAGYRKMVTACAALLDTVCRVMLDQHPKINENVFEWWLKVCQMKIGLILKFKKYFEDNL